MKKTIRFSTVFNPLFLILIILFAILLLIFPDLCTEGGKTGLLLSGNVIIPTLFPFTFCSLYITNSAFFSKFGFIEKLSKKVFRLNSQEFSLLVLGLIGGYPTAAKLIDNYFRANNITEQKANLMLCYCTNAGPAFVIMAVGIGILNSKDLGYILFCAHILSSLIIAVCIKKFYNPNINAQKVYTKPLSPADNIVRSATDASTAVFSVCVYVILFSVINSVCEFLSKNIALLSYITPLLEVTNGVANNRNIYHISFLLGFGGLCVACQVSGLIKSFKFNLPLFITMRTIHGFLSLFITVISVKIFNPHIAVFSNNISFSNGISYKNITLTVSLVMMGILFIISTFNKNTGKFKESVVQ